MSYFAERFEAAVLTLVGEGRVKQRLACAYSDYLEDLHDDELPTSVKNMFSELDAALHRVPPIGKETQVRASVQKMSVLEASAHAETILKIYSELVGHSDRAEPLTVIEGSDKAPPRYLVSSS